MNQTIESILENPHMLEVWMAGQAMKKAPYEDQQIGMVLGALLLAGQILGVECIHSTKAIGQAVSALRRCDFDRHADLSEQDFESVITGLTIAMTVLASATAEQIVDGRTKLNETLKEVAA